MGKRRSRKDHRRFSWVRLMPSTSRSAAHIEQFDSQLGGTTAMGVIALACRTMSIGSLATAFAVGLGAGGPVWAADCGGAVPCRCGDTVKRSTTLSQDVGVCTGIGLSVVAGVVLDCAHHAITGSALSPAKYGVHVDHAVGATVRNCRVTGFRKGIRL